MTKKFNVNAKQNSSTGGKPLNTGIKLKPGNVINVSASKKDIWAAGAQDRASNANGLGNPLGKDFGLHAQGDYKFLFGSLIGTLDEGKTFFGVGTNLTMTILTEGTLSFVYWDSNNRDNLDFVEATVKVS